MGIHSAGGVIIFETNSWAGGQGANDFIKFIKTRLCGDIPTSTPMYEGPNAGWESVENIGATMRFNAFDITDGNVITIDITDSYTFFDPAGHTAGRVIIDPSLAQTMLNFGAAVHSERGWNYTVGINGGFTYIQFTDISEGNMIRAEVTPSGSVGLFDYSPDGAGTGRTWGGGYKVRSNAVSLAAIPLTLKLTTVGSGTAGVIAITPDDDTVSFDGIGAGTWILLANRFQLILMMSGGYGNGTFLFASHLYPARGLSFCNYISGPTNPVARNGGARDGFEGIGGYYYVNSGSPFTQSNIGTTNRNPILCVPGYSYGISHIDQVFNPIGGVPIQNDLQQAYVFDAFLAIPKLMGGETKILGWIWDAVIHSNYISMDSTIDGEIEGKKACSVLAQVGDLFNTQGSLLVQCHG